MDPQDSPAALVGVDVPRSLVVVGSSAGGLAALSTLLAPLPADFPAPILVVQHLSPDRPSLLAEILGARTKLRVVQAAGGERLAAGTVFLAPPDHHLVVHPGGTVALSGSPRVRFSRPSADVLFDSAAAAFGGRVVAVVLTGRDSDGSLGAVAVRAAGGRVIAQEPGTAEEASMPEKAIESGAVDFVLPLEEIPAALTTLVTPAAE
ncbi:MAG TPA: chemotaxis protein CheB [Longimicrobiaceae bacterium]|nr:chemotaxis protein CheB [Longimicrobiaceae bacterium]